MAKNNYGAFIMQDIPAFLYGLLSKQYGSRADDIVKGYCPRITTLRANTLKTDAAAVARRLAEEGIDFSRVDWYADAFIINSGSEKLRGLPEYERGEIYLQSLSSMLPPLILDAQQGSDILDMAAAPGSKTTQIAALTGNGAFITACECNKVRADRLKYNLQKQGASRVNVMVTDARKLDSLFSFNKILLDAPCSGSGTLDVSDAKSMSAFSEKLVQNSATLQAQLIKKACSAVKPGGEVVYSTCSVLEKENEDIVRIALKEKGMELVPITAPQGIPLLPATLEGTVCVCPTGLYEGFFVAKLRRIK